MSRPLFSILRPIRNLAVAAGLGRFEFPRSIYRSLKKGLKNSEADIDGHHFFLDPEDSLDLSIDPNYEAFEREVLASLVQEGDTVLDLGANIGFFTLFFARRVGPRGNVIAFEPDRENFELLRRNIERNGYKNVTAHRKAIAERNGTARLYLSGVNKADHRLYDSGDGRPFVEVEAVRLDDFLSNLDRIDLVKMDIQGAEPLALEGMKNLLKKNRDLKLFVEFWPAGLRRCGNDPMELMNSLDQSGFQIYHVNEGSGQCEVILSGGDFMRRFHSDSEEHVNLLCEKS